MRFVIQKHAASTLHYDFRLEVDGMLRSWAVPKGPSTDPREKRLAVEVEDHPLAYGELRGRDRPGLREGRGDRLGPRHLREPRRGAIDGRGARRRARAVLAATGEKLRGGWTLRRTRGGDKPQWLLIKRRDEGADARRNPQSTQPESVLTGRTIEEVAGE